MLLSGSLFESRISCYQLKANRPEEGGSFRFEMVSILRCEVDNVKIFEIENATRGPMAVRALVNGQLKGINKWNEQMHVKRVSVSGINVC